MSRYVILAILGSVLFGCGGGGVDSDDSSPNDRDVFQPAPLTSFQWQLQGDVNTDYPAEVYDIDLFDVPAETIAAIQASGKKVVCYFSAGSYEEGREDSDDFPPAVRENELDGWPGEYWLDIRADSVKTIMRARLDLAATKGCDAVEPDNVDGYDNDSGFPLTANDQLAYNRFLADAAHERGLGIGLKNDLDQIEALVDHFDFAVNEQCFEYDECDRLAPFIAQNKAVFAVEYETTLVTDADARARLCADAASRQITLLVMPLELDDSFRLACP